MAYGRLSTPKFYIDAFSLAMAVGEATADSDWYKRLYYFTPTGRTEFTIPAATNTWTTIRFGHNANYPGNIEGSKYLPCFDWVGALGIDVPPFNSDVQLHFNAGQFDGQGDGSNYSDNDNWDWIELGQTHVDKRYGFNSFAGVDWYPGNGYCLVTFPTNGWQNSILSGSNSGPITRYSIRVSNTHSTNDLSCSFGSFVGGWSWSPDVSPGMNLTEEYSIDGVTSYRTEGGKNFSKINYAGSPNWNGGLRPFQRTHREGLNASPNSYLSFRKRWKMSFNYMADTKLKPQHNFDYETYTGGAPFIWTTDGATGGTDDRGYYSGIGDDFISKVWYGTMGGNLPFMFQPDSDLEEFHIVKFAQKSVKFDQIAHNTHNISFELEEVW